MNLAEVLAVLDRAWAERADHVHGLACFTSATLPKAFRVDVCTDTRDGHFRHRDGGLEHVRSGRHRKPGRIEVALPAEAWAMHEKHLYLDANNDAAHLAALVARGVELLVDMAHQRPDPPHHAIVDRDEIARGADDWRCVWARRVESEPPP